MPGVTPARLVAFNVVRRVFEQGAYADRALHGEARGLDRRDRAFATALAFGTVQRRGTLDWVIEVLARPVRQLDPAVVAALRLGLFQLLFFDGVGRHAAVGESVELAKAGSNGGHKLVNAVLRRVIREPVALPGDVTPAAAAVTHSYPQWVVELWWERFGAEETRELLAAGNRPAELALRANALVTDREALAAALPVPTRPAPDVPEGLVVEGPFDAHGHPLWVEGAFTPQSRASMRVAHAVDPQPGERVLDLCAAPGGKTTHLAALMGGEGEVVAVERHPGRARALQATVERMRAASVRVEVSDAARPRGDGPFDRVLVDPPCSGLGTLQGHPDVRWRATPEGVEELAARQERILETAVGSVRPGGRVVYSTCTLVPRENEEVVAQAGVPVRRADLVLPHRDGTDGFLIATLSA
ncbi:MAG: 16S rRNA (cytosine(967)-C(5))-methyltransferase RsmB [Actinomycetota bacterium]|nr:16S rRNA (cytosine(967)-C(5))-methyltransferase RsmB [Actinomycetota bacterium]